MPDIKRKYEIIQSEDKFDVATAVHDIGDKQVFTPEFIKGVSHVAPQIFFGKWAVPNPTVQTFHWENASPNTATATITSLHSENANPTSKTATVTSLHAESVA